MEREDIDWEKKVSYYEFESVTESYNNKQGEKRFYKRIARVDYKDVKLRDVYARLMEVSKDYLVHRHMTILDKVYWARFLCNVDQPILWMDYSMNIKLTEKNQVQSAHFSGKQQTLHDSLIQDEDGNFDYIYHLSDDTNHDSVLTIKIIEDIISLESGIRFATKARSQPYTVRVVMMLRMLLSTLARSSPLTLK